MLLNHQSNGSPCCEEIILSFFYQICGSTGLRVHEASKKYKRAARDGAEMNHNKNVAGVTTTIHNHHYH